MNDFENKESRYKIKCPKCGSKEYQAEKRPNGDAKCLNPECAYFGKFDEWFKIEHNEIPLYIKDEYDDEKFIDARGDIILAKGGDGTLLRAINKFRHLNKPFYGIAAGTENFLMNNTSEACGISDNAKYKVFTLINVKVTSLKEVPNSFHYEEPYEHVEEFQAFNDVMIGGDMNSWIDFNVHDKDKIIGAFKGGGIIVSTAQGSTGINKNNNGVILPLSSDQWSITGDKTNRKINYVIEPKRTRIKCDSRTGVHVWVDGHNHVIDDVLEVEISKGDKVTVIFNDYDDFKRKRRI
jgi:NAD kinase